ncbi:plasma-membrane choline transporter-domain-containing protein, partial [Gorgonomyces haynaldii]
MFIVAYSAVKNGDIRQLTVPKDYLGNYCGVNNTITTNSTQANYADQTSRPYLYYFNPVQLTSGLYVCVASCPNVTRVTTTTANVICRYDSVPTSNADALSKISSGLCTAYTYASSAALSRCLPSDLSTLSTVANVTGVTSSTILSAGTNTVASSVADIVTAWPALAGALGASLILCFIWLLLLQVFSSIIVWITILGVNLVLIAGAAWLYFYWQAELLIYNNAMSGGNATATGIVAQINSATGISSLTSSLSQTEVNAIMYAFYVMAVIAGIILLICIAMIRRIAIAVQILKVASQACMKMPLIVFFPISIWIGICGLLVYFIYIGLYLITPTTTPPPLSIGSLDINYQYMDYILNYFHLFGFLWGVFFLSAFSQTTVAGAIASWYWTIDKTERMILPVTKSAARTCRYHLGSLALGSFLVALIELIRIIFYQISRQLSKSGNSYLKYLVACIQCCLSCISMLVKFINKNAYIMIAVNGKAFFKSAGDATALLIRNAAKTVAINLVSDFILILSKLIVSATIGFALYVYLSMYGSALGTIRNPYVIVVVGAIGSFIVAIAFFSVYHMAIDTIFLCALEDMEKHDGEYMPDKLRKVFGLSSHSKKGSRV